MKLIDGVDLNSQKGINGATPTAATDLAIKSYVDARPAYTPPQAPPPTGKNFFTDAAGLVWASLNGSAWQPASQVIKARLYRNAAWTQTNSATVPFDTYDYGTTWNLSTGTTFTAPVAGDYLVSAQLGATATASQYIIIQIRVNAAAVRQYVNYAPAAGGNLYTHGSDIIPMNANDTSDLFTLMGSGNQAGIPGRALTYISHKFLSAQ